MPLMVAQAQKTFWILEENWGSESGASVQDFGVWNGSSASHPSHVPAFYKVVPEMPLWVYFFGMGPELGLRSGQQLTGWQYLPFRCIHVGIHAGGIRPSKDQGGGDAGARLQ